MRKPNGYGSIKKLSGKRRRPYVFLISAEGKQKPLAYFATQTEAEIYAADYNKKHNNKILSGHQITFAELYYRWLSFHTDKYQPAKTTLCSYKVAFQHCLPLHEMPLINGIDTVLILIYTGMRVGELLSLTKDNIYLRQKYLKITKSKTKAGLRSIPIHEKILPLIINRMNKYDKFLICDETGNPYNYSKYRTLWNKIMQQINAKHSTHDCRHTCATLMDNAEVNFNAKRRILGHSDGDVTDTVYTHKNLKQLRKAINKIK